MAAALETACETIKIDTLGGYINHPKPEPRIYGAHTGMHRSDMQLLMAGRTMGKSVAYGLDSIIEKELKPHQKAILEDNDYFNRMQRLLMLNRNARYGATASSMYPDVFTKPIITVPFYGRSFAQDVHYYHTPVDFNRYTRYRMGSFHVDDNNKIGREVKVYCAVNAHRTTYVKMRSKTKRNRSAEYVTAPSAMMYEVEGGITISEYQLELLRRSGNKEFKPFIEAAIKANLFRPRYCNAYPWYDIDTTINRLPTTYWNATYRYEPKKLGFSNVYTSTVTYGSTDFSTQYPVPYNAMSDKPMTCMERLLLRLDKQADKNYIICSGWH